MWQVRPNPRLGATAAFALGLLLGAALSGCANHPKPPAATPPAAATQTQSTEVPSTSAPVTAPSDSTGVTASEAPAGTGENDPFEKTNRKMFAFNQYLDRHVMRPVAIVYRDTLPDSMRDGVHNFLSNLGMPVTIANDVLQARPRHFIRAIGRLGVNSSLGIGGFVDVATKFGMPEETADFGQTLGIYGAGEGPYLVLPFVGPKPPRDLAGGIVDIFFDPIYYIRLREKGWYEAGRTTLELLDDRSRQLDTVDKLESSSIDFYATVRNLYRQDRNAKINGKGSLENLPDF